MQKGSDAHGATIKPYEVQMKWNGIYTQLCLSGTSFEHLPTLKLLLTRYLMSFDELIDVFPLFIRTKGMFYEGEEYLEVLLPPV